MIAGEKLSAKPSDTEKCSPRNQNHESSMTTVYQARLQERIIPEKNGPDKNDPQKAVVGTNGPIYYSLVTYYCHIHLFFAFMGSWSSIMISRKKAAQFVT